MSAHFPGNFESIINTRWENTIEIERVGTNICYYWVGPVSLTKRCGSCSHPFVIANTEVGLSVTGVTAIAEVREVVGLSPFINSKCYKLTLRETRRRGNEKRSLDIPQCSPFILHIVHLTSSSPRGSLGHRCDDVYTKKWGAGGHQRPVKATAPASVLLSGSGCFSKADLKLVLLGTC